MQMILQWLRKEGVEEISNIKGATTESGGNASGTEKKWMIEFVATKSTWTIDLVMLLHHYFLSYNPRTSHNNIIYTKRDNNDSACPVDFQQQFPQHFSYLFCSTKFGVDKSYNSLGYYKDSFSSDELRVQKLFHISRERSLPLLQTSHLSLQVLVDVISRKGVVAIVLLDNIVLRNNTLYTSDLYSGHYVVICGVSYVEDDISYARLNSPDENDMTPYEFCFIIKNPGSWKNVEFVTPSIFEKAWRATGTDEDIIFIAKHVDFVENCR